MTDLSLLQSILLYAVPVLYAIALHEAAHGYAARYYGDRTAEADGRLTLNPLKHIDPIGTILVPAFLLISAKLAGAPPFLFGWARPVPVMERNLRNPKRDMIIVAAAGPAANLFMAAVWTVLLVVSISFSDSLAASDPLRYMSWFGLQFNVLLAVFNMLPIPPLDGGRVLTGLLPPRAAMSFAQIEPFGFMIVIALVMTGVLRLIISPVIDAVMMVYLTIAGLI